MSSGTDPSRPPDRLPRVRLVIRGALVSVGAVAIAFAIRMGLQSWMGASSPFLLFTPAVMVAAFSSGVLGGIVATALSAVLGSRFFLAVMAGQPEIERWDRVGLFILVGALITVLTAVVQRTRRQLTESVWREQKARADAEAANQAKDEFLALVSHELQTPASVMLGWLSMIHSQHLSGDALKRALEVVERNARLQTKLVADVLDTSRIANGTMRLDRELTDLTSVVRGAVDQMRPAIEAHRLRFDTQLADDRWPIQGDATRLQQVFTNLLSNAAKFTQPGGRVVVAMTRTGNDAIVLISDTGIGISQEFIPQVFERFAQEQAALTFSRNGLGLGLSICRHLVQQHDGDISVRSGGRNQGSTFAVRLPLATVNDGATPQHRPALAPDALRSISVLLVEDDDDTRALLAKMLTGYGATVNACRSAIEAELWTDARSYDVLLCDLRLPHSDGLALIRKIRNHAEPRVATTPAASISASTRPEDREEALTAGFEVHLQKPVAPEDLALALLTLTRPAPNATTH